MNGHGPSRRILVPADEFHASLALVRGLRTAGYLPLVAVSRDGTYAARSRAACAVVRIPSAEETPDDFAPAIARVANELRAAAILPGTEAALLALSRHRDELPVPLGAPPAEIVEVATDKARVMALAAKSGLAQPEAIISRPAELIEQAESITYPAVLKPQRTRMWAADGGLAYFKARRVTSADELRSALASLPDSEWVIQPFISGGLLAVSGVAWEGQPASLVHQRSLRIWPPDVGYSCYAETTSPDHDLERRVTELVKTIGWSGIFQLQLLQQDDGARVAIDFNPRAYGSLALAMRAGANLPGIWAARVLGETPPTADPRPGVRYRLETGDAKAVSKLLMRGDVPGAISAAWPRRRTAHAIVSLRDPAPASILVRKALARLAP